MFLVKVGVTSYLLQQHVITSLYFLTAGNQKDSKPSPAPPQRTSAGTQQKKVTPLQAPAGPSPIVLPLNVPVTTVKTVSPSLTTVAPQPVIVNNQVFSIRFIRSNNQ